MKTNVIYCDDNLERLAKLPEESIDLIYLDPPFFSNRKYEIIWGDEGEVRSFEDRWEGGIEVYIGWMKERVIEMHRILKDTGSIYLHCDWHASHYLKIMMDTVFGMTNFRNEIVWHYRKWTAGNRQYQRNHDVILYYSKTDSSERVFNIDFMERTESTKKRFGNSKIISGYNGDGKRIPSKTDDTNSVGVPRDDVWDINRVPPVKQLFPTQKPEALLERIIKASSNENDVVLDPFCGCGTTLAVADKLNRKWVGIDISQTACALMKLRLQNQGVKEVNIIGMPVTVDDLKKIKPFEFQNWVVIEGFNGTLGKRKVHDMGIDGFSFMKHEPIQVKQSEKVGRNVVDNFETAMKRVKKKRGFVVAFSFTKGAFEEAARCKREEDIEINLIKVEELLKKNKDILF